ncbi:MAG TPA: nicotinate-nucleotide--dimethylbenzimidazole phosphoribosyltransferase [Firmicutes bacterium]|nr:nicotinate-nucleotide--dimethylbenzimidazole phosphoribosyltransferase [Bacillota bacterium]
MQALTKVIDGIKQLDEEAMAQTQKYLDSLIKPLGSLGKLESIAVQLAGISGRVKREVPKKCIVIMCADNGVWEEGVTSCPQEITASQTRNFTKGICGINVLARHAGADLRIVDIGVKEILNHPQILNRRIRPGTWNMAHGPAMTRAEAIQGIKVGVDLIARLAAEGYGLIGTGEMGAGNTSTSSAVLMGLMGCDASVAVGKGAGLTQEGFLHKQQIIERALTINQPDPNDPLDLLSKVGGFDLAGLTGCFLGAAYQRIPIVIDGFISAVAALLAYKLQPLSRGYMIPSHRSAEPGVDLVMRELGLQPFFHLEMRLGEGTGCPFAFFLVDAAVKIVAEMATFQTAALPDDYLVDIRNECARNGEDR